MCGGGQDALVEDKTRDAAKGHGKDRLLKAWDYLDAAGMPQEAPASKLGESTSKMKWVKGKRKVSSRTEVKPPLTATLT